VNALTAFAIPFHANSSRKHFAVDKSYAVCAFVNSLNLSQHPHHLRVVCVAA